MNYVVGTAGHVDHGKSTLIHALTGIDPDRLQEEKRRGMTIDLGFAHLRLPSGRSVGIVDVPGHARFVHNMLAGVHGMDAVLLVIAADEGVMPQTREHLDVLTLLGVRSGLVVLTKADLVEPDWLALVSDQVGQELEGTPLEAARLLTVSATRGEGLDGLCRELDQLLSEVPERQDYGVPRLPIDRVFTISGFGTVVTGTLQGGRLSSGEELEISPAGRRVRIRGLQQHGGSVPGVGPGSRVAANLVGVDKAEVTRGDTLTLPGRVPGTRRLDASVMVLRSASALGHGADVVLYTGAAEVPARVTVLGAELLQPGGSGFIRLFLRQPVSCLPGDPYVLRVASPALTLGGGVILDCHPKRHGRHDRELIAALDRRSAGEFLAEELAKHPLGITLPDLVRGAPAGTADTGSLEAVTVGQWLFAVPAWERLLKLAKESVGGYHREFPLRPALPREELRARLRLCADAFSSALPRLAAEAGLVVTPDGVAESEHLRESAQSSASAERLLEILESQPLAPPSLPEAMRLSGSESEELRALVRSGQLVKLSDEVAFTRSAYDRAVELVREVIQRDGSVTVATLRDRMHASRRPVLALLEHLDAERVTRRVGDARVLRETAGKR